MAQSQEQSNQQSNQQASNQVQQSGAQQSGALQSRSSGSGNVSRRSSSPFDLMSQDFFSMHPFTMMRRMSDEMDRMFAEAFGGVQSGGSNQSGRTLSNWTPAIEVKQQGNQYMVCAELPGLKKEDVKVELQENALVIQGERKYEHQEDSGGIHRSERRYGQFYRAVPLPEGAETDKARARFENGMLEVSVPVAQQAQRREIPIEIASADGGQSTQASDTKASSAAASGSST